MGFPSAALLLLLAVGPAAAAVKEVPVLETRLGAGGSGAVGTLDTSRLNLTSLSLTPILAAPGLAASPLVAAPQLSPQPVVQAAVTAETPQAAFTAMGAVSAPPAEDASADAGRRFDLTGKEKGSAAVVVLDVPSGPPGLPRLGERGAGRRQAWLLDGKRAEYLDGGGFKDVLIHPDSPDHLVTLFNQAGAADPGGSRAERNREIEKRKPLVALGVAPQITGSGLMEVKGQKLPVAFLIQERVHGQALRDSPAKDLSLVEALFDKLVAARIKLEDDRKMAENLMIGRTRSRAARQAWVVDAGEAEKVPAQSFMDKLRGKPDLLRAYYDGILSDLRRGR